MSLSMRNVESALESHRPLQLHEEGFRIPHATNEHFGLSAHPGNMFALTRTLNPQIPRLVAQTQESICAPQQENMS